MLPYLTARRHIGPLDVMVPGYTTAAQYHEVCARVVREAQWVVLDRSWSHPDVLRAIFPSMRDPDPPAKRAPGAGARPRVRQGRPRLARDGAARARGDVGRSGLRHEL